MNLFVQGLIIKQKKGGGEGIFLENGAKIIHGEFVFVVCVHSGLLAFLRLISMMICITSCIIFFISVTLMAQLRWQ